MISLERFEFRSPLDFILFFSCSHISADLAVPVKLAHFKIGLASRREGSMLALQNKIQTKLLLCNLGKYELLVFLLL